MATPRRVKCLCCKQSFRPDPRQKKRQRYCSTPTCRRASKAASQKKWLNKPQNKDYFSSSEHVQRVQAWRALHPGYWRRHKPLLSGAPLQETSLTQATDNSTKSATLAHTALQEIRTFQAPVLIGIIAHLTGETLQDQIAITLERLLTLGANILNNSPPLDTSNQGARYESQTHQPASSTSHSPAL